MTIYNRDEKPPKHILKKGDLQALNGIDNINGIVIGGLTGGAVGAMTGAITGAVVGLVADDVINTVENDLGVEEFSKADIKLMKKEAKDSLAKKKSKKTTTKTDNSWFGDWW